MTIDRSPSTRSNPEPIAIVGAGCWLPGGITSLADLHDALRAGRDLITEIPEDRWNVDAFYDPDPLTPAKTYVRKGGFVNDIDKFDAAFFGITDSEATRMDPQQRMVLQTVWHALEDAGQSPDELAHSNTGVYLAMMNTNGYSQIKGGWEGLQGLTAYDAMADAMSIAAGRIAHFYDLEGPALTLDTACSSSLVAVHLARQAILTGECDLAIVAGVNAILHPGIHITFSKLGLMSRAGRCAAFDASADGYIRGEGCMAVILRRQSDALTRGDRILASIVGTAVNQDGHTPAVTAPNGRAQEKVIRSALARVGVRPSEIGYLEAHGTGTPVGDPIEMSAIANVYGPDRETGTRLYVGSVKSNFGHIEAGAGLLGLVKAALSLYHGEIFPSLHFKEWNPNIDLGQAPIEVPTALIPWPASSGPRMAGVNSFGYSGTNAHAILQEPARIVAGRAADKPASGHHVPEPANGRSAAHPAASANELVVLSAKSKASLEELVDQWLAYLERDNTPSLADIAFTAATGRAHLGHRLAVVGNSKTDVAAKLRTWREGRAAKGLAAGQSRPRLRPRVAFMFTGQGAQYAGMTAELYRAAGRFAQALDRVAAVMDAELGTAIKDVLYGPNARTYLSDTRYVQPALFAVEYALAEQFRHWGIEPDFVIGHSVGEITAACIAGALDLDDAVRFVVARGQLMGGLPEGGKMVALGATEAQARQWLKGYEAEASIAAVNGPQAVVVSGTAAAMEAVTELALEAGLRATPLDVSHAFHSPLMDPILDELAHVAASIRLTPARLPLISNVTGDFHSDKIEPAYWSQHVRQAVLFHAGIEKIVEAGATLLVEIGPNPALTPAVATAFDAGKVQPIPTLKRDGKDLTNLLGAVAQLFAKGVTPSLDRLFWSAHYQKVTLPLYPFRKERHWATPAGVLDEVPDAPTEALPDLPPLHPLLGEAIARSPRRTVFKTTLATTSPWTDHRVLGSTVFPGTAYLDMAARAYAAVNGQAWVPVVVQDVAYLRPLLLAYRKPKTVTLTVEHGKNGAGAARFMVAAADNENEVYCQGRLVPAKDEAQAVEVASILPQQAADLQIGPFYNEMREAGLEYGARFSNVREVWIGPDGSGQAVGRVAFARFGDNGQGDPLDTAVLLDGCLHVFGAALRRAEVNGSSGAYVPAGIQAVTLRGELPPQVWSEVKLTPSADGKAALAEVRVITDAGQVVAEFSGLELRQVDSLTPAKAPSGTAAPISAGFGGLAAKTRAELLELLRPMSKAQRVRELSKWLTAEIKETLGQAAEGLDLDSLPPNAAFLEIGLDSLMVTELQRRIQGKLEFRFKPMQGLDYQSIESMAAFLHDEVLAAELQAEPLVPEAA